MNPAEVELGPDENAEVILAVKVPEVDTIATADMSVEVTAKVKAFIKRSQPFAVFGDPDWTQPSPKFSVGEKVNHENLGECTVQDATYGWNGESLVYAVETGTGAIKYVSEDQLSSTGPTPQPEGEGIPWVMVAVGIVVIVVVIAIAGYWIKKK